MTTEAEIVYQGIQAVAGRCDGARSEDGVGFNGQDTHFGRRIASVPFSSWTPDIVREAARISLTYKGQIQAYTGVDVATLPLVREAAGLKGANRVARDQARDFERVGLKAERKAVKVTNGYALSWNSKDPDTFGILLDEVKRLPGRRWDRAAGANFVDASIEALEFIERHAVQPSFSVEEERERLAPQPVGPSTVEYVPAAAPASVAKAAEPQIRLISDTVVRIKTPWNPALVEDIKRLPGRKWEAATKTNTALLTHDVLRLAEKYDLVVEPTVADALKGVEDAGRETAEAEALLIKVSGSHDPSDLPEAFLAKVLAACPNARLITKEA